MIVTVDKVKPKSYPSDEVITCKLVETNGTDIKLKFRVRGEYNWIFFSAKLQLGQKFVFHDGQDVDKASHGIMFTDLIPRGTDEETEI